MKTKIIEFATALEFINLPKPARAYIPEWYRKAEKFIKDKPFIGNGGNKTVKNCIPFLDAYTSGYIAELWQDILVTKTSEGLHIDWNLEPNVAGTRPSLITPGMPISNEYDEQHFIWHFPFYFRTPPGYSVLVTHPFNRLELPFTTLTGVVDADMVVSKGNLPFFLKKDFEGIIPMGTPIAQFLPFKREDWKTQESKDIIELGKIQNFFSMRVIYGYYKKNVWAKKNYN